ncbi:MAG: IS200/IS605 family transposase [Candidatus Heimdallarchaeota archaeon]|nr:IS200/IS605 family transposase [Candidatus Heimdallarchaeota archaeon]
MEVKKTSHAAYRAQYHIVWTSRFARKILVKGIQGYLKIKILEVRKHHPDWEFIAIGFGSEHVHVCMEFPPRYSGAYVIETIKKNTSRELKKKYKFLSKVYWDGGGIWSVGYFFSTIGINEKIIKRYIEHQGREDSGQAKLEF